MLTGGTLWVVCKTADDGGRGEQFEESWLVGLDPDAGTVRHAVYLATAARELLRRGRSRNLVDDPHAVPAAAGGLVYAPTGRGVLAAVDAASGRIEWLNAYDRAADAVAVDDRRGGFGGGRGVSRRGRGTPGLAWQVPAPVVAGGRVFYRPPDADAVLVYDAADGRQLAELPVSGFNPGEPADPDAADADPARSILAVEGDRLYATGGSRVYCLNWPAVAEDVAAGRTDDDARLDWLHWQHDVPPPADGAGRGQIERLAGRPAVTQSHVAVPARDRLVLVDAVTGQIDDGPLVGGGRYDALPGAVSGDVLGSGGNVVAVQDRLVVAGPQGIGVFADGAAIRRRLELALRDRPDDPAPRLRLAAIDFAAGDAASAVAALEEAAALAGGRRAALSAALGLAASQASRDAATSGELLSLADRLARTPRERVEVQFARAADRRDPAAATAAMRRVLAEGELGRVPVAGGRDAAAVARRVLLDLRGQAGGRDDPAAARALANAGDDPEKLSRVADVFPYTEAAADALSRLADGAEDRGDFQDAAAALRRLRGDRLLAGDRARANLLTQRLADLDAGPLNRPDLAEARLRRLARDDANPELARRIAGLREQVAAAASPPRLGLPGYSGAEPFAADPAIIDGVDALLAVPPRAHRHDRLVVRLRGGEVAAYAVPGGDELFRADLPGLDPAAAAWLDGGDLLVWGEGGAARVAGDGSVAWRASPSSLTQDSADRGPPVALAGLAGETAERDDSGVAARQLENALAGLDLRANGPADPRVLNLVAGLRREAARGAVVVEPARGGGDGLVFKDAEARLRLHVWPQRAVAEDAAAQFVVALHLAADPTPPTQLVAARPNRADAGPRLLLAAPARGGLATIATRGDGGATLALLSADGPEPRWLATLPAGRPVALAAAGDHAVVRLATDGGGATLAAYDLDTGRAGAIRDFPAGGLDGLANFLPLDANELAVVTPRRVRVIDLADPRQDDEGERGVIGFGDGDGAAGLSAAAVDPSAVLATPAGRWLGDPTGGRLTAAGDVLLALSDPRTAGRRDAAAFDLAALEPLGVADAETGVIAPLLLVNGDAAGGEIDAGLLPHDERLREENAAREARRDRGGVGEGGDSTFLRVSGSRVYVAGRRGLTAYDLSAPNGDVGPHWRRDNHPLTRLADPAENLDLLVADDFALLIDSPLDGDPAGPRATPFSRAIVDGKGYESGLEHRPAALPADAADWRLFAGGLAVLDEGGRVTLLRGAGD